MNQNLIFVIITKYTENNRAFNNNDGGISLSKDRNFEISNSIIVGRVKSQKELFKNFLTKMDTLTITKSHHMARQSSNILKSNGHIFSQVVVVDSGTTKPNVLSQLLEKQKTHILHEKN